MISENYLSDATKLFENYKDLAEKAIAQVDDKSLFIELDEDSNSIAIIVKHIAGNLRSRWRNFLTSDGEKPDRNRDGEFMILDGDSREKLISEWEVSWKILFDTLNSLTPEDMEKTILIRSEEHTVVEAMNRQLTHYAYHVGQIVYLARHFAKDWKSLSVPKGQSEKFNREYRANQEK